DVAARGLDAHVVGDRRDGAVAGEALRREPAPHVLLVEALRLLARGDALLVAPREPDPRAVRRVHLVDDDDRAVRRATELVLRVDEDEPARRAHLAAPREERVRDARRRLEGRLVDDAATEER